MSAYHIFDLPILPRRPNGLKVVLFAGGGGSCTGIEQALDELGDPSPYVDAAVNHDPEAVAMHRANHPRTRHYCQNVWQVRPQQIIDDFGGRPIDLLWASPDCKHFSKVKGGKPVEKNIRDLGWVVHAYTRLPAHLKPLKIYLENVEEYRDWGPLIATECPAQKGMTFKRWLREFRVNGYKVAYKEIRACDVGTPTIRKRLYVVATSDGTEPVFPEQTHAAPLKAKGLAPYRTAAECIDFSLPCPSIFGRPKELAPATKRRIARGVDRYVLRHANPFLVQLTHTGADDSRVRSVDDPVVTQTCAHRGEIALVTPHVTKFQTKSIGSAADEPLHTTLSRQRLGVVAPTVIRTDMQSAAARNGIASPEDPLRTATSTGGFALAAPVLAGCGGRAAQSPPKTVEAPLNTATAKADQILVAPVIAGLAHGEHKDRPRLRSHAPDEPTRTIHAGGGNHAVIAPTLVQTGYGERPGQAPRSLDLFKPLGTPVAGAVKHAVVAAHLAQHNTGMVGHDAREPVSTIVQKGCTQAVVSSSLINLKGSERRDGPADAPAPTQCAQGTHIGEVRAFLVKYYDTATGQTLDEPAHTLTAKARLAVVTAETVPAPRISEEDRYGAWWVARFLEDEGVLPSNDDLGGGPRPSLVLVKGMPMVDIGMRMLQPRELFNAQGFPPSYVIDRGLFVIDTVKGTVEWRPLTKTSQIRMCGNSVCPPVARALILANHRANNDNRPPGFADAAAAARSTKSASTSAATTSWNATAASIPTRPPPCAPEAAPASSPPGGELEPQVLREAQTIAEITDLLSRNTEEADITFLLDALRIPNETPDLRKIVASYRRQLLHAAISETYRRAPLPRVEGAALDAERAKLIEWLKMRREYYIKASHGEARTDAAEHYLAAADMLTADAAQAQEMRAEIADLKNVLRNTRESCEDAWAQRDNQMRLATVAVERCQKAEAALPLAVRAAFEEAADEADDYAKGQTLSSGVVAHGARHIAKTLRALAADDKAVQEIAQRVMKGAPNAV